MILELRWENPIFCERAKKLLPISEGYLAFGKVFAEPVLGSERPFIDSPFPLNSSSPCGTTSLLWIDKVFCQSFLCDLLLDELDLSVRLERHGLGRRFRYRFRNVQLVIFGPVLIVLQHLSL